MDREPVFALLLYCVTDPDQGNNSCVPTFLIASLCETWKQLLFASRDAHKTREGSTEKAILRFSIRESYRWGDAQRKLMRTIDKFLSADCASPSSASPIRQIFVQVCQTLNTRQGIMSPPRRPCREHICCRNLRFK